MRVGYKNVRHEYYPDGEPAPRIMADYDDLKGKRVALVIRSKQLPTRDSVCRLLHNAERETGNLSRLYGAEVDIIMPYYLLGRQDKDPRTSDDPMVRERDKGKDIGYEFIARSFKAHGANRIITITPHFHRDRYNYDVIEIEGLEIVCISGVNALARYARELIERDMLNEDALIIAPDEHAYGMAERFRSMVGENFTIEIMEKKRISGDKVTRRSGIECGGKEVVIIDDILSTMGTIKTLLSRLNGARHVDIFAVHGVLPEEGLRRARGMISSESARRIITTDTVDNDYARASIIPDIAKLYLD